MRKYQGWTTEEYETRLRKLESELYVARMNILYLMPDDVGALLRNYYRCETRQETHQWIEEIAEILIEKAKPIEQFEGAWGSGRAYCPLCAQGSSSPYQDGYSLPEGLRRHLVGWGNSKSCPIMEAALGLARETWNDKFSAAEELERQTKRIAQVERRKFETLYQLSPYGAPKLLDEGSYSFNPCRSQKQLEWAEDRLKMLGLNCQCEGNALTWIDEREDLVIYADPRFVGRITFSVWKKPLPKRSNKHAPQLRPAHQSFYFQDSWKNELIEKYELRVRKSI